MTAQQTATRILILDDEKVIRDSFSRVLLKEGYAVEAVESGRLALEKMAEEPPDVILLDLKMPGIDGMETLRQLREKDPDVVSIMITGYPTIPGAVRCIQMGALDYLVKPFSVMELLARVRAVLRRAHVSETGQDRHFTHTNLRIDLACAEVWRDEHPVFLSATEYRLLLQFAHNVGKVLTAEELLGSVWGPEYRSDKEILWVTIARLRQKVEDDPHNPKHIVTRSGLGYLMPPAEG